MKEKLKELILDKKYPIGSCGVEREMLRVDENGVLAFTPHPHGLGNKCKNPFITTDFSESQIEVITPAFVNSNEVFKFLNDLYDITVSEINDEFLWPQSMPCKIPKDKSIPVAEFGDKEDEVEAKKYREKLLSKYGGMKQLISGVHYNFSFSEEILKGLYFDMCNQYNYIDFKNEIYLKVARNYLRYRWLLIYLLGCTSNLHKSFIEDSECIKCYKEVVKDSFIHEDGISYRNGEYGYRNLVDIFPDYNSVEGYVDSIKGFIKDKLIDSHKELYSQIRLKASNPKNFLDSLQNDGIKYLEYRTIDVNPFEKSGIALIDLEFLEVFNLYLLLKNECDYENWQEEALENQDLIAKFGKKEVQLKRNGKSIGKFQWGLEILKEIEEINREFDLGKEDSINTMINRLKDSTCTYAYRIEERVKRDGFINAYMELAKQYKDEADKHIKDKDTYLKVREFLF